MTIRQVRGGRRGGLGGTKECGHIEGVVEGGESLSSNIPSRRVPGRLYPPKVGGG
jgi:hypothetical protein